MPPQPRVIVVAYGDEDLLRACLATLAAPAGCVVVVDNGRSDRARQLADSAGAVYLRPARNVGFAAGVNLGLADRQPDQDVLLLNPDAAIGWADVLALQARLHARPRAAAVAPRLVGGDGEPAVSTWPMPTVAGPWLGAVGATRLARSRFVIGAVLLLRADALAELGGFDERFFLYAEETDWQRRALVTGWSVDIATDVVATHLGAGTSSDPSRRLMLFHASTEAFVRKWHGAAGWQVYRLGAVVAAGRRALLSRDPVVRREQAQTARLYLRGPRAAALAAGLG